MSRQGKVGHLVREGMQGYEEDDNDSDIDDLDLTKGIASST